MNSNLLFASETTTVHYEFVRAAALSQWWHWLLLAVVCATILGVIAFLYRRDSVELPRGVAWTLLLLRVVAFLGILFFFLGFQRRIERELPRSSRVALLVDTSQSMGLKDSEESQSPAGLRRIDQVLLELKQGSLLAKLREMHDVVVYRFDQNAKPVEVAALRRTTPLSGAQSTADRQNELSRAVGQSRTMALVAGGLLAIGLISGLLYLIGMLAGAQQGLAWAVLVSTVLTIGSVVVFAAATLRAPDVGWKCIVGLEPPDWNRVAASQQSEQPQSAAEPVVDWDESLMPRGLETRLGEALHYLVDQERGGPIAGIVVFSDGEENAGSGHERAIAAARDAELPVFTVGLGSDQRPINVRVADIDAPQRVYPGDRFTINAYLQSFGLENRSVNVELSSRAVTPGVEPKESDFEFEEQQTISLGADGELISLNFAVEPTEEGRRDYKVQVKGPAQDKEKKDDQRVARVQVVERRNRVLLLAGGPTREYRFLRNLLYRDDEIHLSVLLQTGKPGISQESDELLFEFPRTADELFEYDCIVAFDPDWLALDENQINLLERWVAEQAGGLIVVAGPVHTPQWTRFNPRNLDSRIRKLRDLYPVVLYRTGSVTLSLGRFGGTDPWKLQFTRDGQKAEFLWLADDARRNEEAWSEFDGVYGYYAVKDPKPGARIYAYFSDPSTRIDDQLPIYLAGHFYGAGRVFFQASGEMWRVRAVDDTYFQQYYTKLIRWVSQGRLLRDSTQGVLLVDKDRCLLGDQVGVRAILTNEQHEPLDEPQVTAVLFGPDGHQHELVLRQVKDGARAGMYSGQFTALLEGDYRVELKTLTNDLSETSLVREVRAQVPQREIERPERNDALLTEIAEKTRAEYFIGMPNAMSGDGSKSLPSLLVANDQSVAMPGSPDKNFDRQLMTWLMGLICGVLCLEWLIRRIGKLA